MKKIALFSAIFAGFLTSANAAEPVQRRGGPATAASNAAAAVVNSAAPVTQSARAARMPATVNSARSAAPVLSARSGAVPVSSPVVSARAAATQKVIGTGTKIAGAGENTVVSDACRTKYEGCMDSFCMVDNTSGGRCLCSNRSSELDTVWDEIQKLDAKAYKLATEGVEKIEMGTDAGEATANASAIAKKILESDDTVTAATNAAKKKTSSRANFTSIWDSADMGDDFNTMSTEMRNPLEGKTGDNLHRGASSICLEQMKECGSEFSMLQMIYANSVKADCTAYENELKKQKNVVTTKISSAEKALRDAALESLRTANKWDLGQCTVEFKKCMATTAGCKDDFTGCVSVSAADNTNVSKSTSRTARNYTVKGAVTSIEISASTYDQIMSKKPLCDTITNSCTRVKDQVWNTFLREVAPQLKSAEIIAENDLRMNCVGRVSDCFKQGCKDTMDPKDPEGSFDMCLTRPEAMLNVCKIPLNSCGISTASLVAAQTSTIWDFITARLASMRVDACTTQVQACLLKQCGEGYSLCMGMDRKTIRNMCDPESLLGCQEAGVAKNGEEFWDNIDNIISVSMLGVENEMANQCQSLAEAKVGEVCGGLDNCDLAFQKDERLGTEGLALNVAAVDKIEIIGIVDWSKVPQETTGTYTGCEIGKSYCDRSLQNVESVKSKISAVMSIIKSDMKIGKCINGVDMKNITGAANTTEARYPHLLDSYTKMISDSGITQAKHNYEAKYDKLMKEALTKLDAAKQSADGIGAGMCYDKSAIDAAAAAASATATE